MNKSKSKIELRQAIITDSELLAQICESNIVLYDLILPGAFKKQAEKYRANGIKASYDISIIEKEGAGIGFTGTISLSNKKTYLVALYLLYDTQRQGFGNEVMNIIIKKTIDQGDNELLLLVHCEATWAISFYKKYGFRLICKNEADIKAFDSGILDKFYIPNTYLMALEVKYYFESVL